MKQSNSSIILQQRGLYSDTHLPSAKGNDDIFQLFDEATRNTWTLLQGSCYVLLRWAFSSKIYELEEKY